MQPVPGCRIRVWKKEWQQTVGSQTSLTTGTRRIAKRIEPRPRREKRRGKRKENKGRVGKNIGRRRKGWRGKMSKDRRGNGMRKRGGNRKKKRWDVARLMDDLNNQLCLTK